MGRDDSGTRGRRNMRRSRCEGPERSQSVKATQNPPASLREVIAYLSDHPRVLARRGACSREEWLFREFNRGTMWFCTVWGCRNEGFRVVGGNGRGEETGLMF